MIYRHPKRWCDECKQMVFSREHGHKTALPATGLLFLAALTWGRFMSSGDIRGNTRKLLARKP